jgi:hypothetical protein
VCDGGKIISSTEQLGIMERVTVKEEKRDRRRKSWRTRYKASND